MGNLLHCCLRHLFRCKDIPEQIEEQSPLLSRENSDVESLSPSRSDMLASPILDQDHLLYPDIVLSSSHRANLDRADLSQQLELVLPERGQNKKQTGLKEECHEGFEQEARPRTRISQQEYHYLERNQLCTTEKEWPLLSSLHSWPSEQTNASDFASQTLIYTHGQGNRYWQASLCEGVQLLAQGNGSSQHIFSEPKSAGTFSTPSSDNVAKVSTPRTEIDIIQVDESGIQDEDKAKTQLGKGTEQMELNVVRMDQNVAQLGHEVTQRAKYFLCNVAEFEQSDVCSDENVAQLDEVGVKVNRDKSNHMEHYPVESGQTEAQYRQSVSQTEEMRHETVILISQNGEDNYPGLEGRPQTSLNTERNQKEIMQTEQYMVELDSFQTEVNSSDMDHVTKTSAHPEQHISENEPEFAPNKNEEEDTTESKDLGTDNIHANLNQGPQQNERFTLFVVDKLFLATPNITGVYSEMPLNKKS